jgi:hypothetical protein
LRDENLNRISNLEKPAPAAPPLVAPRWKLQIDIDRDHLRRQRIFVSPEDEASKIAISAFKSLRTHMLKAMQAKGVCTLAISGTTRTSERAPWPPTSR